MSDPEPPPRPPIAAAPLSIVLTAHDAGPCWQEALAAWESFLAELGRDYEILLIADGPTVEHPHLRRLHPAGPPGAGAALRAGLAKARNPLLVFAHCDPRYRPEDLKRLLERIDAVDLVIGCRIRPVPPLLGVIGWFYRKAARVLVGLTLEPLPSWLGWKNRLYHGLVRGMTGVRLHDVNCGFQLFRREMVASIPIQAAGAFASTEIIAKANFLGCLMDEVPIAGPPEESRLGALLLEGYRVLSRADFGEVCG